MNHRDFELVTHTKTIRSTAYVGKHTWIDSRLSYSAHKQKVHILAKRRECLRVIHCCY